MALGGPGDSMGERATVSISPTPEFPGWPIGVGGARSRRPAARRGWGEVTEPAGVSGGGGAVSGFGDKIVAAPLFRYRRVSVGGVGHK